MQEEILGGLQVTWLSAGVVVDSLSGWLLLSSSPENQFGSNGVSHAT